MDLPYFQLPGRNHNKGLLENFLADLLMKTPEPQNDWYLSYHIGCQHENIRPFMKSLRCGQVTNPLQQKPDICFYHKNPKKTKLQTLDKHKDAHGMHLLPMGPQKH